MSESCAILDAIRGTIVEAAVDRQLMREDGEAIAERVEVMLRREFGPDRHYIPALGRSADRKMALDLLSRGTDPQTVARKVGVHLSTVYRWRRDFIPRRRRQQSGGFANEDWAL